MLQEIFSFCIPESNWKPLPPSLWPDFSKEPIVGLDFETQDPEIDTGLGWINRSGRPVGFSISDGERSVYLPIGHSEGNVPFIPAVRYLKDFLDSFRGILCFCNSQYDLGWVYYLFGAIPEPKFQILDVGMADALIYEEHDAYSLKAIAKRRNLTRDGKFEAILNAAASAYGIHPKKDLWKLHPKFVGQYAEEDARLPVLAARQILSEIRKNDLGRVLDLEMQCTWIYHEMKRNGIRIDQEYAIKLSEEWLKKEKEICDSLKIRNTDLWDKGLVLRLCADQGIPVQKTAKGNPSAGKDFLLGVDNPVLKQFVTARAINRSRTIYLEQNLIKNAVNSRIHPEIVQIHCDEGGTRTGRCAMKNPNGQQFPKRSTLFKSKDMRKCLIAEDGFSWGKLDYWSQEPVIQNHYAIIYGLPKADLIRESFVRGEKLYTIVERESGGLCSYDQAKEVILGRSYGMGAKRMAERMNIPKEECARILQIFDQIVPYVSMLANEASNVASMRGYVRTFLGRRRNFELYIPAKDTIDGEEFKLTPRTKEQAENEWPGVPLARARTHKAFNAIIQGTAADQAKKATVDIYRALGCPTLPVHDELNHSRIKEEKDLKLMKEIAEKALPLRSFVRCDADFGRSWQ